MCGDCNAIGVIHTSTKYGGEKSHFLPVTDGVSAVIGVIHTGPKFGGEMSNFLAVTVIVV